MSADSQTGEDTECPTCGREFTTSNGMKTHHKMTHGESLATTVTLRCEWCGRKYQRHPNQAESSRFCSNDCQQGHWRETIQQAESEDNEAGLRKQVIERDGATCQMCGGGVARFEGADAPTAEVHHIIPKAAGGPDALENLVTLCPSCHPEAHRRIGDLHETAPDLLEELREAVCEDDS